MNPYQIEHLFTYRLQLAPPQVIGPVPGDVRLDFPIVGGEITGPRLQGNVRPGGADFGTLRTDGIFLVDVRGTLESHDGALIEITYTGVMDLGPDGYEKFLNGEAPASAAVRLGVDGLSIDGFECAGHPGEDDIPGLVLIPAAAAKIDIPMIASGGFADARGLVAALALGADGVNMGSRFMCTVESCIHHNVTEAIVAGDERGTELIFRPLRNTARVASNLVSREVVDNLNRGGQFDDVRDLVAGVRGRRVFDNGDVEAGIWTVGTAMGLINDIPTVGDLVARIVDEAEELIAGRLGDMIEPAPSAVAI